MAERKGASGKKNSNNRYVQRHRDIDKSAAATRHINLGTVVFLMVFVYIVVVLVSFALRETVSYTIAETGILSNSAQYEGLVIRNEKVFTATGDGQIRYFFPEGARVRRNNPVFGIVNDPEMMDILDQEIFKANQSLSSDDPVFQESYDYLRKDIRNYVINHYNQDFDYTYMAKKQILNGIEEIRNTVILSESAGSNVRMLEEQYKGQIQTVPTDISGLVSYKIDGMEGVSIDTFELVQLTMTPQVQDTSDKTLTETGQPVFKVVDNYLWYMAAEIDDECEKQIEGKNYIGVHFPDKDIDMDVYVYDLYDYNGRTYLILRMDRMVNEFLTDRFVNFTITYENHEGIKVPESAVTDKSFAVIPNEYLAYINKRYVVLKKVYSEEALGHETIEPVPVKIFRREEDVAYVPVSDLLDIGDELSYTDGVTHATSYYTISETVDIDGVYVINKGYAMFKFIETLYKENDYRIVDGNMNYGIRVYDRIATDAETTEEYQIIN